MSIRIAGTIILSLCLSGVAQVAKSQGSALDAWLQQQQASGQLAAASVALIDGDEVTVLGVGHADGVAGATPGADTRFQIGSITKVFTHLLLAEMVAADVVRHETTLGSLLPDTLTLRNPAVADITLQALATHRSGLPRLPANLDLTNTVDPYAGYDAAALHAGIVAARERQPLGTFYTYSNFGVGLLGHVLGRANGDGYRAALQQRVIAPLRLQHTGFAPDPDAAIAISGGKPVPAWGFDDALAGAGALWGSVSDLARLVRVWTGSHGHGLKHEVAQDLDIVASAGEFEISRAWHVARAGDVPVYWHNGGTAGFHSFVGFRMDTRQGVAILASGDADPTAIGLQSLGVAPMQPRSAPIDTSVFGQYPLSAQFGIGVFESDGALVAQATGQPSFTLHPIGDDWYALGEIDASLHFMRGDDGVTGLELAQGGALNAAPRAQPVATVAARQEIEIKADALAAYVGEYHFGPGAVLTVKQGKQALEVQLSGQPFLPVYPRGGDRFFYKVVDAELQFERDASGAIVAVVLHQGGIEQRAPRAD